MLAAYCDVIYVDKQTAEDFKRASQKERRLDGLIDEIAKAGDFEALLGDAVWSLTRPRTPEKRSLGSRCRSAGQKALRDVMERLDILPDRLAIGLDEVAAFIRIRAPDTARRGCERRQIRGG